MKISGPVRVRPSQSGFRFSEIVDSRLGCAHTSYPGSRFPGADNSRQWGRGGDRSAVRGIITAQSKGRAGIGDVENKTRSVELEEARESVSGVDN